jgi:hypothetical protein
MMGEEVLDTVVAKISSWDTRLRMLAAGPMTWHVKIPVEASTT